MLTSPFDKILCKQKVSRPLDDCQIAACFAGVRGLCHSAFPSTRVDLNLHAFIVYLIVRDLPTTVFNLLEDIKLLHCLCTSGTEVSRCVLEHDVECLPPGLTVTPPFWPMYPGSREPNPFTGVSLGFYELAGSHQTRWNNCSRHASSRVPLPT